MSLEESVNKLTTAVHDLASQIKNQTSVTISSGGNGQLGPLTDPPLQDTPQKHTIDNLREFAGVIVKADPKNGYDTALKVLNEFSVQRFDELNITDYDAAAAKFEAEIKKLKKKSGKKGANTLG